MQLIKVVEILAVAQGADGLCFNRIYCRRDTGYL